MGDFILPQLPYTEDALEPVISARTLEYHHGKHHAAYINMTNKLKAGTEYAESSLEDIITKADGALYNNAAQAWNHTFYFNQFGKETPIKGTLADAIVKKWESIEKFKTEFANAGATLFGSGWVWLVVDSNGELSILKESNAGNPLTKKLTPLLTFDVWEHAYYLDYQNLRADHLNKLWNILDWNIAEIRYVERK